MNRQLTWPFLLRNVVATLLVLSAITKPQGSMPLVESMGVPVYPPLARTANVEGVVHLEISTDGHGVLSARAQDGPKLLAEAAEANARTWRFAIHEPATFTVTFRYSLTKNSASQLSGSTIVLRLPTEVNVSTKRWPGTVDMPTHIGSNRN